MGGLGCPAALYLAAAGVGTLGIADYDLVSSSNLHRQVLYGTEEIGKKKVQVAARRLKEQNPDINILSTDAEINSENVISILSGYDIVIDATDNFETKYLLNDAAILLKIPLVYGAIYQYEGQLATWNMINEDGTRTPHYRDVFPEVNSSMIPDCREGGVLHTLAGVIGCLQATEVIKYITKLGEMTAGKMLLFNGLTFDSRLIQIGHASKIAITQLQNAEAIPTITMDYLLGQEENYTIIDVRSVEERNEFHIGGIHIPFENLEEEISRIELAKPIIFYCASGRRSQQAAKKLNGKLNTKLYSLAGGLNALKEKT
jgi:adenylyltransferase/sulfurtransferase